MRRLALLATYFLASACGAPIDIEDLPPPPIHTPLWAFEPWISKDISSTDDTRDFVSGFETRHIPVGVVVLDSPWETAYNTFVPNPVRYHDFDALVSELHGKNIRVVCWITQMLNSESFDLEPGGDTYPEVLPLYHEALDKKYFVNDSQSFLWWKGKGGAIDFFNPEAARWWHRLQDPVLMAGLDGWKLDFGDSYVMTATVGTARGVVSHQEYSEAYYRDFYAYGANLKGRSNFLTMVRAWDESYQFSGRFFAKKEHAPVAWMGDNRRDYIGLADALDHMFRSSRAGYAVVGSDIGGYLDRDDRDFSELVPFDVEVFAHWTALGAMTPFMQLHGRANIAPWTVPERADEIVESYRFWAILHHELAPFFYSLAEEIYAAGSGSILNPLGEEAAWKGDYRYLLGDAFLVAPILDASGARAVALPEGARWYDWWAPAAEPLAGGQTVSSTIGMELGRIPLFVKEGAIVPARSGGGRAILGDHDQSDAGTLTLAIWPADHETRMTVHPTEDGAPFQVSAIQTTDAITISISASPEPLTLRIHTDRDCGQVTDRGEPLIITRIDTAHRARVFSLDRTDGPREIKLRCD